MQKTASQPVLEVLAPAPHAPIDLVSFVEWLLPDGTVWAHFYRTGDGYLLRFPSLADFVVSPDGTRVAASPLPGLSRQTVEHLYLNQVLPLALSRQFKLVLHASAIELDDFAVAFMGASGRGKSTLAASFATAGYRFLTDDGLRLEEEGGRYLISPSHPSIRLWDDSRSAIIPKTTKAAPAIGYTSKARLLADDDVAYCEIVRPLRCMYFLGEGKVETISIEALSGREVMIELLKHCFLLDVEEREMLKHQFAQLTQLARMPIFFRLDYPRQYDLLPKVREAVIRHATTL